MTIGLNKLSESLDPDSILIYNEKTKKFETTPEACCSYFQLKSLSKSVGKTWEAFKRAIHPYSLNENGEKMGQKNPSHFLTVELYMDLYNEIEHYENLFRYSSSNSTLSISRPSLTPSAKEKGRLQSLENPDTSLESGAVDQPSFSVTTPSEPSSNPTSKNKSRHSRSLSTWATPKKNSTPPSPRESEERVNKPTQNPVSLKKRSNLHFRSKSVPEKSLKNLFPTPPLNYRDPFSNRSISPFSTLPGAIPEEKEVY